VHHRATAATAVLRRFDRIGDLDQFAGGSRYGLGLRAWAHKARYGCDALSQRGRLAVGIV